MQSERKLRLVHLAKRFDGHTHNDLVNCFALGGMARDANATVRHNDVSMHSRWRLAARSFITGRRCCHTEAIEM
jgi:hypothetical protein